MSVSIPPEGSQIPNDEPEQQLTGSEPTPTPPIQPTPSPRDSGIDPAMVNLMQETIREQNRVIADQNARLAAGVVAPPAPARTDDEIRQEFFSNPEAANRRIIREELEATVRPLLDFVNQAKAGSQIDILISRFKGSARFSQHWTPELEAYVREQAGTIAAERLNDQTFQFLVTSAIGLQAVGQFGTTAPTPAPTPTPSLEPRMPTPPHMRPSAPAGPAAPRTNDKPTRALNEQEKRLLREYNATKPRDKQMTEADYIKWQEMDAGDVATTTFDRGTR